MNKRNLFRGVLAAVAAVTLCTGQTASAKQPENLNKMLSGDFRITGTGACLSVGAPSTFDPDTLVPQIDPLGISPTVRSDSSWGVIRFNGDGTGRREYRTVSVIHPNKAGFNGSGSSAVAVVEFTYQVEADWSFSMQTTSFTGTVLRGIRKDQMFTVSSSPPSQLVGQISKDGEVISFTQLEPTVQTQTYPNDPNGTIFNRICHGSWTGIKKQAINGRDLND